jgi:hypothetical protein
MRRGALINCGPRGEKKEPPEFAMRAARERARLWQHRDHARRRRRSNIAPPASASVAIDAGSGTAETPPITGADVAKSPSDCFV